MMSQAYIPMHEHTHERMLCEEKLALHAKCELIPALFPNRT